MAGTTLEGGRVAAAALGDLEERVSRPLVVIAGMMANKDAGACLANFAGADAPHHRRWGFPAASMSRRTGWRMQRARSGMRVENAGSVQAALHALSRLAYEVPPRTMITARSISPAMS